MALCIAALEEALARLRQPEIFRTQIRAANYAAAVHKDIAKAGIQVSMDRRGRWMDNVFIERLWPSLKYKCVYRQAF